MACADITQGYEIDCLDGVGGVKEVYIMRHVDIDTITEVSGVVTAIVKKAGKRFFKYQLPRETGNAEETITSNEQNGTVFYGQTVNLVLNKRQVSVRNEVMALARLRIVVVVVENKGTIWLFGKDQGLVLASGTSTSGTAWGDRNGYTLPFTGNEPAMAPGVDAALIASLETPA